MNKYEFTDLEKEMINFNFEELQLFTNESQIKLANATSAADVSSRICELWNKVARFIRPLSNLPFAGRFVKILVDVLDSICPR